MRPRSTIEMRLPALLEWQGMALSVVERAARIWRIDEDATGQLCRVAPAAFALLCGAVAQGSTLDLEIEKRAVAVRLIFSCTAPDRLEGFNLFGRTPEEEDIASSLLFCKACRTRLDQRDAFSFQLIVEVDKGYPTQPLLPVDLSTPLHPPFSAQEHPPATALHQACQLAQATCPRHLLLKTLRQPARFVDLVQAGEMYVALASDAFGRTAGLMCWQAARPRSMIFFGPYVFAPPESGVVANVARCLTEQFLSSVARTGAVGVYSGQATPALPEQYFEQLGVVNYASDPETRVELRACYRHLREDFGSVVLAHAAVVPFLREQYERLAFVREFRQVSQATVSPNRHDRAVLFPELRLDLHEAVLHPLRDGEDFVEVLGRHLARLRAAGVQNIFFHQDLAEPWQSGMTPSLLDQGFRPALLLPCGGRSDVIIYHHA